MTTTRIEHEATIWMVDDIPVRMFYAGHRWRITDTPTRLRESIWATPGEFPVRVVPVAVPGVQRRR
ncbi:hypothetical protein ACWKWN_06215 [Microbacterium trichothecenolyticum]